MKKELTLSELIDIRQNFNASIAQKLLEFDVFFQNHMWDGYSDEDDPRFISPEDYEAIQALSDKMEAMIIYIGSPSSIPNMLQSIADRKIKYWQHSTDTIADEVKGYMFNEETKKGKVKVIRRAFEKGRQLKNKNDINRVLNHQGEVIKGHFRWNRRGYLLSRTTTDLLQEYINSHF